MKVYLVVDDGPVEWGEKVLRKAFTSGVKAKIYIKQQKQIAPYENQYLIVRTMEVE